MRLLRLVLDTNVVLDWLVFRDAGVDGIARAISERRVQIVAHAPALDELRRVLAYPQCKLDTSRQQEILDSYRAAICIQPMPDGFGRHNLLLPADFPRCRDRDDEHFLALAYHARADALMTKDKAILGLRKRARRFGVTIVGPRQFDTIR
jgi:putative PIN family toxin of toxin-antitoxin system